MRDHYYLVSPEALDKINELLAHLESANGGSINGPVLQERIEAVKKALAEDALP